MRPPTATGFDPKEKAQGAGLQLRALERFAKQHWPDPSSVIVAFERTSPYRAVTEVIFTLRQSGASHIDLLVQNRDKRVLLGLSSADAGETMCPPAGQSPEEHRAALARQADEMQRQMLAALLDAGANTSNIPTIPATEVAAKAPTAPTPLAERSALCVGVLIEAKGITVRANRDRLAPGCETFGDGPTIPPSSPADALQRCIAHLVEKHPTSSKAIRPVVSAEGPRPFQEIVVALDALHDAGLDPALGVAR
jgi:hypothetical protein